MIPAPRPSKAKWPLPALSTRSASAALVIGGMMWGLYWIPVRFFQDRGLDGPWPGIAMYAAALLALSPLLLRQRENLRQHWHALAYSGLCTGASFSLFTTSLAHTEVVRSILLFYLTPIWGTVLGLVFLGERLDSGRVLGLAAGLGGLFIVLGQGSALPWPQNAGDWLALLSGVTWALGTLGLYRTRGTTVVSQAGAFLVGALVISAVTVVLSGNTAIASLEQIAGWPILPYVALSAVYVLPMIFLTIWPATLLSPARVGLLLMSEVIVGISSAALFSGEPFGPREAIGATLIISAALIEAFRA